MILRYTDLYAGLMTVDRSAAAGAGTHKDTISRGMSYGTPLLLCLYSLTARISPCHGKDPGSIPGTGVHLT